MEDEYIELANDTAPNKVPTFIKVLCILSWIWIGFTVLNTVSSSFVSDEERQQELELAIAQFQESPMASNEIMQQTISFMEYNSASQKTQNIVFLIFMLIEGVAVFMIFKLQRKGFWLYVGVQVGYLAALVNFMPWPNMLSTMSVAMYAMICLLFVILYGVNLKHLK